VGNCWDVVHSAGSNFERVHAEFGSITCEIIIIA
jgi:hypothetical protein